MRASALKATDNRPGRTECVRRKPRHEPGMFRNRANRAKHVGGEFTPALDKRLHELAPRIAVCTERSLGIAQVALQQNCGSVVERMGERSWRMNPLQSMI